MPKTKPRATKLMLHAFLGSNLLVSFYFAAMASFKVAYLVSSDCENKSLLTTCTQVIIHFLLDFELLLHNTLYMHA